MKKLLLISAALAVSAGPIIASASPHERRQDRKEIRQDSRERHQDRKAARSDGVVTRSERRELHQDTREIRGDRRELRYDRRHPDSWKGRPEWREYHGPRAGYWYAPGYGYHPLTPGFVWKTGVYVPPAYRAWYVSDVAYYGLRPPPPGYRWVYADGHFVLMQTTTGLITELIRDAF
jgi:Ni/Co efflux regulator RcnB